jgi:hypothetical protein
MGLADSADAWIKIAPVWSQIPPVTFEKKAKKTVVF